MEEIKIGTLTVQYDSSNEMYWITALWKEAGSDPNKSPCQWLRLPNTKSYISMLQNRLGNSGKIPQFLTKGSKGTYAHW